MAETVLSKIENKKTDAQEYTHTVGTHTHTYVLYTQKVWDVIFISLELTMGVRRWGS